ncbi:F-box domain containing protein [Tanacetum coccineum]
MYRVPNVLLSASSLTSLKICRCELPSSLMVDVVKFKCLKMLELASVPLNDEVIKRLITNCPLLEKIFIDDCEGVNFFCVNGLENLREVKIGFGDEVLEVIDTDAPNLCHLSLVDRGSRMPSMKVASCKKLTKLSYDGHPSPTSEGLVDLSSDFPFLEELYLVLDPRSLKLSSHSLRTFVLWSDLDFDDLRQFLDKNIGFKELKLCIDVGPLDVKELMVIQSSPYELEHVELYIKEWFTHEKLLLQEDKGTTNIRILISSSSKVKKHFGDLNSFLTASPRDQQGETITFTKEEGLSICSSTLSLVDGDGSSVSGVILLLLDGCSRTSAAWEVVVFADGKASNGGAVAFKTASKVKFGGNDCVAVRDKGMWLKQVIVAVAVPSSITALKQYLLVIVGLFLHMFYDSDQ